MQHIVKLMNDEGQILELHAEDEAMGHALEGHMKAFASLTLNLKTHGVLYYQQVERNKDA